MKGVQEQTLGLVGTAVAVSNPGYPRVLTVLHALLNDTVLLRDVPHLYLYSRLG